MDLQRQFVCFDNKLYFHAFSSVWFNGIWSNNGVKMEKIDRIDTTKEIRKQLVKQAGEKYLEWFDKNIADFKKFWLHEFIYPIAFPLISLAVSHYIFHFNFTREQGIIMFMLFYLVTITGRLLAKYNKLVTILDPLIDKVMEIEKGSKKRKQ